METIGKDSLHQRLMDKAYSQWTNNHWTYPVFVDRLDPTHRAAVLTGNLNYQVLSGGFRQWDHNGYSSCAKELMGVLDEMISQDPDGISPTIRRIVAEALAEIRRYRELLDGLPKGEKQNWDSVQMLECLSDRYRQGSPAFLWECESFLGEKDG